MPSTSPPGIREEIAERSNYSDTHGIGVFTRPAPGMVDLAEWVRELR